MEGPGKERLGPSNPSNQLVVDKPLEFNGLPTGKKGDEKDDRDKSAAGEN